MTPLLSVLVISHNQKELLQRCLESILCQEIPFDYEIIVSDDASTDGTWELAQEYEAKYPFLKAFRCNSNDCNPTCGSERSGHNRRNAFNHSCGKYFAHIDADDYYRPGTSCLREMVELLEANPTCSMCMQNNCSIKNGEPLESGTSTHELHKYTTGRIIPAKEYFQDELFINNGVMMTRRQAGVNPADIYHKWYVDSVITHFYLQYGPIVCLDRNDWIYVHYPKTVTSAMKTNDKMIMWSLDLTVFSAALVPFFKEMFYMNENHLKGLLDAVRLILEKVPISSDVKAFFAQFSRIFIYRAAAAEKLSAMQKMRLLAIREYIKFILRRDLTLLGG